MLEKNNRYITRGIKGALDIGMQLAMWQMVDGLKEKSKEVDYLQVFKIKRNEKEVRIEHSQEIPKYKKVHVLESLERVDKEIVKVFVIDDGLNSVMMLAEEY
ncbi:DUF960 family protein [uncultured Clostridium sp.]|uniref:DUF960 family protein n=1 Tax=uncultured Clostridium sp. TaxID=59620 RepID=UPI00260C4687|nr:DUF960 family protein [uncultured Clostridium sp.]